jgi:hypothetical protein
MYGGAGGGTNGEEEAVKTGSLTTSIGSRIQYVCVCVLVVVYSITARRWPLSHLYVSIHLHWNL